MWNRALNLARKFAPLSALEQENWLDQLQEQGQFAQNQFYELMRTISELTNLVDQFWIMVSTLSNYNVKESIKWPCVADFCQYSWPFP